MAAGPRDALGARQEELGVLAAREEVESPRAREGIPAVLVLRTLATWPFVAAAALSGAAGALFGEPALLLPVGGAPVQMRPGSTGRPRHPDGRQAESWPGPPATRRAAVRRVGGAAWPQVQRAGVHAPYARRLVRGGV